MAKPLHLNASGSIAEMGSGDSIDTSLFPAIAVSQSYQGNATLDFSTGNNETSVTITGITEILPGAYIVVWISSDDTTADHTAGDHSYFGNFVALTAGNIVSGVGLTIYARSIYKLTGQFKVRYSFNNDISSV